MSAHHILGGWSGSQGFGCSPIKVVRELGSERRETVRSLSAVGVGGVRGSVPNARTGWTYSADRLLWRQPQCSVAMYGRDNR